MSIAVSAALRAYVYEKIKDKKEIFEILFSDPDWGDNNFLHGSQELPESIRRKYTVEIKNLNIKEIDKIVKHFRKDNPKIRFRGFVHTHIEPIIKNQIPKNEWIERKWIELTNNEKDYHPILNKGKTKYNIQLRKLLLLPSKQDVDTIKFVAESFDRVGYIKKDDIFLVMINYQMDFKIYDYNGNPVKAEEEMHI